jgi:hypothetical protein
MLFAGGITDLDENSTSNFGAFGSIGATTTSEASRQIPMPIAGTLGTVTARASVSPGASPNAWTVTLRLNGTNNGTCSIGTGATSCTITPLDNSMVIGDLVTVLYAQVSNPTNNTNAMYSVTLAP